VSFGHGVESRVDSFVTEVDRFQHTG
jgi:hypothetical protein